MIAALASQLEALNGEVESASGQGNGSREKGKAGANGLSKLSGADFLAMMNGAGVGAGSAAVAADPSRVAAASQRGNFSLLEGGAKGETAGVSASDPRASFSRGKVLPGAGARDELAAAGAGGVLLRGPMTHRADGPMPQVSVDGHVVPGSMARERLASASLLNMSNEIKGLSVQGGGEMRVRLKPDNLGEIHMRVATSGGHVSLQIHAADERAKKILEESMSQLKDGLASQNLTLGRVEIAVGSTLHASNGGMNGERNDQSQGQNSNQAFDGMMRNGQNQAGNGGNRGGQGQSSFEDGLTGHVNPGFARASVASAAAAQANARQAANSAGHLGRLDVQA